MDRADLLRRLMATFLDELDEHVRTINEGLLTLEKEPDGDSTEVMKQLFRAAHSLKGASRAVEQPEIELLCHHLEDIFSGLQKETLAPTKELFGLMFKVADSVEATGMQLRAGEDVDATAMQQLHPRLQAGAAGESLSNDAPAALTAQEAPTLAPKSTATPIPTATPQDVAVPRSTQPAESPEPTEPTDRKAISASIRVAEEKLDSLLAQAGELLVARRRVEGRTDDVDAILEYLAAWKHEWQSVERTLRQMVRSGSGHFPSVDLSTARSRPRDGQVQSSSERPGENSDGRTAVTDEPLSRRSGRLSRRITEVIEANGQRLKDIGRQLEQLRRHMATDARQLNQAGSALHDDVHRVRMFPFGGACAGLDRTVRDLAQATGKQVDVAVEGGDIEVDRAVLEGLRDPIMHLVRNAVDHGMEPPDDRRGIGKPETGRIVVSAELRGSHVDVTVADDGRGLNLERIRQKLTDRGMIVPPKERDLMRCIFAPGFSTAQMITDVSGRGVGMDVVKSQVEALRGTVDVSSQWGLGSRFVLSVPLTLTTVSVLMVHVGSQTYAVPGRNVLRLVRFSPDDIRSMEGRDVLPLGETPIPVTSLASVLGSAELPQANETGKLTGIVLTAGERETVFIVDAVVAELDVVIKSLGNRIRRTKYVSGATILRSGAIALMLNVDSLIQHAPQRSSTRLEKAASEDVSAQTKKLLVVDDSVTTRTLVKSVLMSAGYDVTAAVDGQEAWDRLQTTTFDLVVSDVDMPHMTGFQLTQTIRRGSRTKNLPVILISSRDSADDRQRGADAGASAYLVKSSFDQSSILETIEQLL